MIPQSIRSHSHMHVAYICQCCGSELGRKACLHDIGSCGCEGEVDHTFCFVQALGVRRNRNIVDAHLDGLSLQVVHRAVTIAVHSALVVELVNSIADHDLPERHTHVLLRSLILLVPPVGTGIDHEQGRFGSSPLNLVIILLVDEHDLEWPQPRDVEARWLLNQLSACNLCGVLKVIVFFVLMTLVVRVLIAEARLVSSSWGSHIHPRRCSV